MSTENALGNGAGLKEHEAQKDCVAHAAPDGSDGISAGGYALYQHGINGNTYQDKQALKAHGEQRLYIVLAHAANFPVYKGGHRYGSKTCEHIYFQHPTIHDDKDNDVQRPHSKADD